jgi:RNA polymerase sigma-70 factor (family 1)
MNMYEPILLEKMKKDDQSAFSFIFASYYTDLVIFAGTFIRSKDIAEEVVQSVFVKLWDDRHAIDIKTSLKSYLLRTVQNRCIDLIRHLKIKEKHSISVLENPVLYENDTENYILYSELESKIEAVLSQLPTDVAQAFRMNRYEGLKYSEIAEQLNVAVRTVEVRISKALQKLREALSDYLVAIILFVIGHLI